MTAVVAGGFSWRYGYGIIGAALLAMSVIFIVTRDDANDAGPRLPRIQKQYERAPEPKELVVLDGSAHAQFVFKSDQGQRLMKEILRFLTQP